MDCQLQYIGHPWDGPDLKNYAPPTLISLWIQWASLVRRFSIWGCLRADSSNFCTLYGMYDPIKRSQIPKCPTQDPHFNEGIVVDGHRWFVGKTHLCDVVCRKLIFHFARVCANLRENGRTQNFWPPSPPSIIFRGYRVYATWTDPKLGKIGTPAHCASIFWLFREASLELREYTRLRDFFKLFLRSQRSSRRDKRGTKFCGTRLFLAK